MLILFLVATVFPPGPCLALGTVSVVQRTGEAKTYERANLKMNGENFAITSPDRAGELVIGKASCTAMEKVMRCLPYDAVLQQYGATYHIAVKSGTLWINPSGAVQTLPATSTQLPSRGVLLKMVTKAGTTVSVSGTIDEMSK